MVWNFPQRQGLGQDKNLSPRNIFKPSFDSIKIFTPLEERNLGDGFVSLSLGYTCSWKHIPNKRILFKLGMIGLGMSKITIESSNSQKITCLHLVKVDGIIDRLQYRRITFYVCVYIYRYRYRYRRIYIRIEIECISICPAETPVKIGRPS